MRTRALRGYVLVALVLLLGVVPGGVSQERAVSAGAPSAAAAQAPPWLPAMPGEFYGAHVHVTSGLNIAAGATVTLKVVGVGGVPATGVSSVALDLHSKGATTGEGALIVYPSDGSRVGATGARYRGDIWSHDLVMTKVGPDGAVKIENYGTGAVTAQVNADVRGYTLTSGTVAGSTFVGLTPARIVTSQSVPAGTSFTFSPLGVGGVPSSGVSHVVFTLVASASKETSLTVYPSGTAQPADVNLHASPGGNQENLVIAQVGGDGKVIIRNTGATNATVTADASGYFATPEAQVEGSVLVPLQPARILTAASIAANSSMTFAPLGLGGVPTPGVSALALNVNVHSSTGTGSVRVYPAGTSPGTWTVGYPVKNIWGSAFINVKLGTNGQIVLFNAGSTAVSVWLDVHGYFKPMTGCNPSTKPSVPSVSIEQFSRTAAMQASLVPGQSDRATEYAYTDNIGRIVHAHQQDPNNFGSVQFSVVSPNSDAFSGQPGLIEQTDGRLQLAARNTNSNMWVNPQATRDPAAWGAWANLGGWMASSPAVAQQTDGSLAFFAVDADGGLWALQQDGPNGAYGCWTNLGMTGLSGTPTVVGVGGGIQVFARDAAGDIKTALYANRTLSGSTSLGGSGLTSSPAVIVYPGSQLRVFARAGDGSIVTKMQDGSGAWPPAWDQVGSFTAAGSPAALLSPAGRAEVIVRGTDGTVYSTGETVQGSGTWRDWVQVSADQAATDPTVFLYTNSSGPAWAFVYRTADQVTHVFRAIETTAAVQVMSPESPRFSGATLPAPPPEPKRN